MKKKLLVFTLVFWTCFLTVNAQTARSPMLTQSLGVSVYALTDDWCGQSTGSIQAQPSGGTPPYTVLWTPTGVTTLTLVNVSAGFYDVTVTDNLGATATGSAMVGTVPSPPFYVLSIVMPQQGINNGSVTYALYPSNGGSANMMPDGTYNFTLLDASLNVVRFFSFTCPACSSPINVFDTLAAGHYTLQCSRIGSFCDSYVEFDLKEMPDITPSYTQLPSCNGSPTGKIFINTHPSPSIDASTFQSNYTSNLFVVSNGVVSKFKTVVFDSLGTPVQYATSQDSLITLQGLLPGNYHLQIYDGDTVSSFNPGNHDSVLVYDASITILSDTLCSLVQGKLFADYNNDCIYNGIDLPLPGTLVELNPGAYSCFTDAAGNFFIPVVNGVYTLKQYASYQYSQLCPDTNTFTISITTPGQIVDVQIGDSINTNPDVIVGLASWSNPRPGFNTTYYIYYKNLTPNIIPGQTVYFDYNASLNFVSASTAPTTSSAGQLTWNIVGLNPFEERHFQITLNVPAATAIGTVLNAAAYVANVPTETNTGNNVDSISQIVSGSYDPNIKEVSPIGFGVDGYITNSALLKYTVRFQNTGNDTAFTVVVADTLPFALNRYSLQVLSASNNYWYEFKNPNVVLFHFDAILLPDSNTNEEASHGFIKFSIAQNAGNAAGTVIQNKAGIVFDFNTPVITNQTTNTIFDCSAMASATLSNQTICEGETINANATLLFDMNADWYIDSVFYTNDTTITLTNLTAGVHQIKLVASNASCSQAINATVIVNALPAKPTFNSTTNLLTSSSTTGNQWFYYGVLIPAATDSFYFAMQNGYYSVMVTDSNGCTNTSDSAFILVEGVNSLTSETKTTLIPNPTHGQFTISGLPFAANDEIVITDAIGKIIYRTKINVASASFKVDVSNFTSGVYFVRIKTKDATTLIKLIRN